MNAKQCKIQNLLTGNSNPLQSSVNFADGNADFHIPMFFSSYPLIERFVKSFLSDISNKAVNSLQSFSIYIQIFIIKSFRQFSTFFFSYLFLS